jgi:hypothetical protein
VARNGELACYQGDQQLLSCQGLESHFLDVVRPRLRNLCATSRPEDKALASALIPIEREATHFAPVFRGVPRFFKKLSPRRLRRRFIGPDAATRKRQAHAARPVPVLAEAEYEMIGGLCENSCEAPHRYLKVVVDDTAIGPANQLKREANSSVLEQVLLPKDLPML